jgi:hypothetical protein
MSYYKNEILKLANSTLLTNQEIARIVGCSDRTVRKYAGSYVSRCRVKTSKENQDPFQIRKVVLLPDIHYPHYEQRVMDAVDEFIIDYEPDELVYMGDQISLDCISFWNKRKPLLKEGQRLLKDFEGFNEQILINHENITGPETKRVFMIGNHEQRIKWYNEEHPELEGFVDLERHLQLEARGYEIIPFNEIYQLGKLSVIHGYYWNKYHAAKTLEAFEGNVVYAHVHNPQMYAKVSPIDRKGYHTATSLGCLCNIKPDYHKNAPNFWINQFGVVEYLPASGFFNVYPITIIEGSFMWNGRYYGKNL